MASNAMISNVKHQSTFNSNRLSTILQNKNQMQSFNHSHNLSQSAISGKSGVRPRKEKNSNITSKAFLDESTNMKEVAHLQIPNKKTFN